MVAAGMRSQEDNNPGLLKKDRVLTIYYLVLVTQVVYLYNAYFQMKNKGLCLSD